MAPARWQRRNGETGDLPGLEDLFPCGFGPSQPSATLSAAPAPAPTLEATTLYATAPVTTTSYYRVPTGRATYGTIDRPFGGRKGDVADPDIKEDVYPSGFPVREAVERERERPYGRDILRPYQGERRDPDMEVAPFPGGFPELAREGLAPPPPPRPEVLELAPERGAMKTAELEAARLVACHPVPREEPQPVDDLATTSTQWEVARRKISLAESEAHRVRGLLVEASKIAAESNSARKEAEQIRALEAEVVRDAERRPAMVREALAEKAEELRDAKAEVDELLREVVLTERDLERAEHNLQVKAQEHKLMSKAARTKKAEVDEVERLAARLIELRAELAAAEDRAAVVERELREAQAALKERRAQMAARRRDASLAKARVEALAQEYAAAMTEYEMADEVVRRDMKEAQILEERAKVKEREAYEIASRWADLKVEIERAKELEVRAWEEARKLDVGEVERSLDKFLTPPAVVQEAVSEQPAGMAPVSPEKPPPARMARED